MEGIYFDLLRACKNFSAGFQQSRNYRMLIYLTKFFNWDIILFFWGEGGGNVANIIVDDQQQHCSVIKHGVFEHYAVL